MRTRGVGRYCNEFDDSEENKLGYTAIHEEFVATIEGMLREQLGAEKLAAIEVR